MADHEKPPAYNYGAIPQGDPNAMPPPPYSATDTGPKTGYPPPQATGQPQTTTTVISQPAIYVVNAVFREHPVSMVCPHCQAHVVSSTNFIDGTLTWLVAGGICLVGCWAGCCLIPFCLDGCKDVVHTCPNCHVRLGVYRRI